MTHDANHAEAPQEGPAGPVGAIKKPAELRAIAEAEQAKAVAACQAEIQACLTRHGLLLTFHPTLTVGPGGVIRIAQPQPALVPNPEVW